MHQQAYDWGARFASDEPLSVIEFGGRDINGTPRALFPNADPYVALDILPGVGIDIVADAATWTPDREYDRVLCFEVFEHTEVWQAICKTAFDALAPGGVLIATMAGPGRAPHSAVDGGPLRADEYYRNIHPDELLDVLTAVGFVAVVTDRQWSPADTRCIATRDV